MKSILRKLIDGAAAAPRDFMETIGIYNNVSKREVQKHRGGQIQFVKKPERTGAVYYRQDK